MAAERVRYSTGDRVVSPDSPMEWQPLRVTEAYLTPGGYCLIRIAALRGGGNWMRAESVLPAPEGTYDAKDRRWRLPDGTDVTPRRAQVLAQIGEHAEVAS